jgi:hypothetical protein
MDPHSDPMIKDKKSLPMSSTVANLPAFLFTVFVLVPLWLMVLLPLTIAFQVMIKIKKALFPVKAGKGRVQEDPEALKKQIVKKASDGDREFDLVMFGATGFTGRLASLYLAKQYGNTIRWAIAGRRMDGLLKIRTELAAIDPTLAQLPIVLADSSQPESLNLLATRTKTVITTAGECLLLQLLL